MIKRLLLFCLLFISGIALFGQNVSNEGRNFFAVFPSHDPSGGMLANLTIFVTSKSVTEATVTCGTFTQTQPIPANTAIAFEIPRNNAYINLAEANQVISDRSIQVTVPAGKPKVAVYSHIWAGARSAASLILPFEALGQNYYSMNYTQTGGGTNYLLLMATEANTVLNIRQAGGVIKTITLPRIGDIYEYTSPLANADLTGVYVEVDKTISACRRFAAFSGSSSLTIACGSSADPLYQQLYTTNSWGKNFGVIPFSGRQYIIRILAKDNNTVVKFNGQTITLQDGAFYESPRLTEALTISSDKPISVAQYSLTQNCSGPGNTALIGDPEMVLLNPVEFSIRGITMFSSSLQNIVDKYVNVYMKTSGIASFKLNNAAPPANWTLMPSDPLYSYIQIPVSVTSLTLTANEPFNSIAYGYGNVESYSYSAGTSLAANQFVTVENKKTKLETSEACQSEQYKIKITVPGEAVKLTWKFADGTEYADNNPVATTSVVNDQTFYTYTLPAEQSFADLGSQSLVVLAESPSTGGCALGITEYNFDIVVNPQPIPAFTFTGATCSNREVSFADKSTINSSTITINKWFWDFGDGTTSALQNPKHTYTSPGDFTVKFLSAIEGGCASDTLKQVVKINPSPVAGFIMNQNSCINTDLTFTDQSTIASGTITKWIWDFGDGTVETKTTKDNLHKYTTTGTFTVKLITESGTGCLSDTLAKTITITILPKVIFTLPEVCLKDTQATFENASVNSDGTGTGLTYLWDFGDAGNATPANPNTSTQKQGNHKYTAAGNYTVSLTVTNQNGCVVKLTQTLTVNGGIPKAGFEVQNPAALCSNKEVVIKNISTVDFGNITRLEWYLDAVNSPTVVIADEDPTPGKLYNFNYPPFSAPLTKQFTIRLVAFSGGECFNEQSQVIVLNASPVVVFAQLPPACINNGTVQLTQASETGSSNGTGAYSGNGITSTGLFNPQTAGAGVHTITYTFTNSNGCSDIKTQTLKVFASPVVNAGADLFLLKDGELVIKATAEGSNLTYKWTPSTGLNRDDVLNPVASPAEDTDYTLTVTSDQGCSSSDVIHVTVLQEITPFNSFSPNGDGINDTWNIKYIDSYPNGTVEIFNRYGDRVFLSRGYAVPFNGTYRNLPLPVGTYYYVITPGNGRKSVTGNLTLLR